MRVLFSSSVPRQQTTVLDRKDGGGARLGVTHFIRRLPPCCDVGDARRRVPCKWDNCCGRRSGDLWRNAPVGGYLGTAVWRGERWAVAELAFFVRIIPCVCSMRFAGPLGRSGRRGVGGSHRSACGRCRICTTAILNLIKPRRARGVFISDETHGTYMQFLCAMCAPSGLRTRTDNHAANGGITGGNPASWRAAVCPDVRCTVLRD